MDIGLIMCTQTGGYWFNNVYTTDGYWFNNVYTTDGYWVNNVYTNRWILV